MSKGIVSVEGAAELGAKFSRLKRSMQTILSRQAVTSATVPLLAALKSAAPRGPTGNLKKSFRRVAKRVARFGNMMTANVYTRAPHAHLVTAGTGWRIPKTARVMSNANRGYAKKGFKAGAYTSSKGRGTIFGMRAKPVAPNDFVTRVWNAHLPQLPERVRQFLEPKILQEVSGK